MSELVSNDKDFLDMVQGGAVDLVQVRGKTSSVYGDFCDDHCYLLLHFQAIGPLMVADLGANLNGLGWCKTQA